MTMTVLFVHDPLTDISREKTTLDFLKLNPLYYMHSDVCGKFNYFMKKNEPVDHLICVFSQSGMS